MTKNTEQLKGGISEMKIASVALAVLLLMSSAFLPLVSGQAVEANTVSAVSADFDEVSRRTGFDSSEVRDDLVRLRAARAGDSSFPVNVIYISGETTEGNDFRGYLLVMTSVNDDRGTSYRSTSVVGRIMGLDDRVAYMVKGTVSEGNTFNLAIIPASQARAGGIDPAAAVGLDLSGPTSGRMSIDLDSMTGFYRLSGEEARFTIDSANRAILPEVLPEERIGINPRLQLRQFDGGVNADSTEARELDAGRQRLRFFDRIRAFFGLGN